MTRHLHIRHHLVQELDPNPGHAESPRKITTVKCITGIFTDVSYTKSAREITGVFPLASMGSDISQPESTGEITGLIPLARGLTDPGGVIIACVFASAMTRTGLCTDANPSKIPLMLAVARIGTGPIPIATSVAYGNLGGISARLAITRIPASLVTVATAFS